MIIVTTTALFWGSITDVVLPQMGIYILPTVGHIIALVWAAGVVYAMVRYKFLTVTPATAADKIISTMKDSLVLLDTDAKIVTVNSAVLDLVGYKERELVGKPVETLFSTERISSLEVKLDRLIKESELRNFETYWKTKDGKEIPLLFSSSAIKDKDGNVIGTVCTATDITDRKRVEEELKQKTDQVSEALITVQQRAEQLASLSEIFREVALSLDINTVLGKVVEQIAKILKAEMISIMLRDKGDRLTIKASMGIPPEIVKSTSVKMGEKISGWVASHQEPLLVENIDEESRFISRSQELYYTKSLISCPLIVKNNTIGVININNKGDRTAFNPYELEIIKALCADIAIAIENARLYSELRQSYINTVESLAIAIDARDHYTQGHHQRVCNFALAIGKQMNLSQDRLDNLRTAALMHDVGKIGISDSILLKPGKLSDAEWVKMKEHPLVSERIVSPLGFPEEVSEIVRHHHERYDGKGYPDGNSVEEVLLEAYILGIADAFDAMMSERPYRKSLGKKKAMEELRRGKGSQFHPQVVDAFLFILEKERSEEP